MKIYILIILMISIAMNVNAQNKNQSGFDVFNRGDRVLYTYSIGVFGVVSSPAIVEENNFNILGTFKLMGNPAAVEIGDLEKFQLQDSAILRDGQIAKVGSQILNIITGKIETLVGIANKRIQTINAGLYRSSQEFEIFDPQSSLFFNDRQVSTGDYVQFKFDLACQLKTIAGIANSRLRLLPDDGYSSSSNYFDQSIFESVHRRLNQTQLEDGTFVEVGSTLNLKVWTVDPITKEEKFKYSEVHIEKIADGCLKPKGYEHFLPVRFFNTN